MSFKGYVSGKIRFRFVEIATTTSDHVVDTENTNEEDIPWTDCDEEGSNRRALIGYQWMRCSSGEVQIDVTWSKVRVIIITAITLVT
jgi:hypothetical protein